MIDTVKQSTEPDAVFEAMREVMLLLRARHHRGEPAEGELAPMEHKTLGFFTRHPGATLSDLAAHSGRDKGQLARLVAGLKARGLLEAESDPEDRRNLCLRPTAAARAVHQAGQRRMRRLAAAALEGVSEDERAQLLSLLLRVRGNLEAAG